MKILVISHEYPPIGGGGGKVVQDLCQGLAGRGHQIRLLTAHYGSLPRREESGQLTIERLPSWRTQPFRADLKAMGAFVMASLFRGIKLCRSFKPDLIHAHFAVPAGAAAWMLNALTGVPYILTAHGGDVPGGAPEKTTRWFRFVLPFSKLIWHRARGVTAVSRETRDLALAHYKADIRVIPNGIDTHAMRPESLKPHSPPTIVFLGRFSPEKNAVAVPKILANLKNLEWECRMIGDGLQMTEVQRLIKENGLTDRVQLVGWVDAGEIKKWMKKSDILLMPSLREGMPIAGLQALAMGLALILPEIGSCPDLVHDNGFLIHPGDQAGYIAAVEAILKDVDQLEVFRRNSRAHAEKFDIQRTITLYEGMLKENAEGGD